MRFTALAITLGSVLCGSALLAQPGKTAPDRFEMPSYQQPAETWRDIQDPIERARCEEKIRQVRNEAGKPEIEPEAADAQDPLLLAAVHQKIENCPVLVMKHDTSDMRPVPERRDGPITIEPAN